MKVTIEGTDREIADALIAMGHRLMKKVMNPPVFTGFTDDELKAMSLAKQQHHQQASQPDAPA